MEPDKNPPAGQIQNSGGGTALASAPGQQGGATDNEFASLTLTASQTADLQRVRRESSDVGLGDNALCVLLVGNAHWTPAHVQTSLGIMAADVARACRAWQERQINGLMNLTRVTYVGSR